MQTAITSAFLYLSELASTSHKAKSDIVVISKPLCCLKKSFQRMARAMVSGVHHDELRRKLVECPKLFPPTGIKHYTVVLRPRRHDQNLPRINAFGLDASLHEAVQGDDAIC